MDWNSFLIANFRVGHAKSQCGWGFKGFCFRPWLAVVKVRASHSVFIIYSCKIPHQNHVHPKNRPYPALYRRSPSSVCMLQVPSAIGACIYYASCTEFEYIPEISSWADAARGFCKCDNKSPLFSCIDVIAVVRQLCLIPCMAYSKRFTCFSLCTAHTSTVFGKWSPVHCAKLRTTPKTCPKNLHMTWLLVAHNFLLR